MDTQIRRRTMTTQTNRLAGLVLGLILATPALAQQQFPWQGKITGQDVYVRSGPSQRSYPVAKISAPAEVVVTGQRSADWLTIRPVKGCFSVVSQNFVDRKPGEKWGTVTGENVLVRAAGMLRQQDFTTPQGKLNKGDRVRIVGRARDRDGLWYVIVPPDSVDFYIASQYVEKTGQAPTDEPLVITPADAPQPTDPAEIPAEPLTPPQPEPERPVRSVSQETGVLTELRALESALAREVRKPIEERNFEPILAQARAIDVPAESRFRPMYLALLRYARREADIVAQKNRADALVSRVLTRVEKSQESPGQPVVKAAPPRYDLQGELTRSAAYNQTPGEPIRYVLRDPQTRKIIGYVQSSDDSVDLAPYADRLVGIKGEPFFDKSLALRITEVQDIGVLDAPSAGPLAAPPTTPADSSQATLPTPDQPNPDAPQPLEATPVPPADEPELASADQPTQTPSAVQPDEPGPTAPSPVEAVDATLPDKVPTPDPTKPTAPEPVEIAPAQTPDEPVAVTPPAEAAPDEPVAVTPAPEPVTPPAEAAPEEPVAVTPAPEPVTPPAEAAPDEPVAVTPAPEPVTPPAETTPDEPVAVTPAPEPVTPPAEAAPDEPVAVTPAPEPVTPPAETTPDEPVAVTPAPEPVTPPAETTPEEPVAVTPEEPSPAAIQPMKIEPMDMQPEELATTGGPARPELPKITPATPGTLDEEDKQPKVSSDQPDAKPADDEPAESGSLPVPDEPLKIDSITDAEPAEATSNFDRSPIEPTVGVVEIEWD
jgi:hypothetical protein